MQNQVPVNKTAVFVFSQMKPITSFDEIRIRKMQVLSNASNASMYVFTTGSELQINAVQSVIDSKFTKSIKVVRGDSLRGATKYLADHLYETAYYITDDQEYYRLIRGRDKDYIKPSGYLRKFVPVTISSDQVPNDVDPASNARLKHLAAIGDYTGFRNLLPTWTRYGRGTVPIPNVFNQLRMNMGLPTMVVKEDHLQNLVTCTEGKQLDGTFCYLVKSDAEAISIMLGLKGVVHQVQKEGGLWWSPGFTDLELKSRIFKSISESEMGKENEFKGNWDLGSRDGTIKYRFAYQKNFVSLLFSRINGYKSTDKRFILMLKSYPLDRAVYLSIVLEFIRQFDFDELIIQGDPSDNAYIASVLAVTVTGIEIRKDPQDTYISITSKK